MTLWIPGRLPGLNELIAAAKGAGGTGRAYSRLKRDWTNTIHLLARAAKLGRAPTPAFLRFVWVEPNRRRDPDNFCAGGRKLLLDGLVAAGVFSDDGWDEIAGWRDEWQIGSPGVRIVIEPA